MRKLRNILLIAVFALVICGPALIFGADKLGVGLPSWMTAENARYLEGGIANPKVAKNLNLKGFAEKKLQEALSEEVEDHIPFKAAVMLGNAALQRTGIELANVPFGWPTYPTFYDSETYYIPSLGSVYRGPQYASEQRDKQLEQYSAGLCEFAKRHPDKRFFVYLVYSEVDPSGSFEPQLRKNVLDPAARTQVIADAVEGAENITVLTHVFPTFDALYEDFFATDHHWTWRGALRAYSIIADAAGLTPAPECEGAAVEGPRFVGSIAREGLMDLDDPITDFGLDFSNLQLLMEDGRLEAYGHTEYENNSELYKRYSFYSSYYDFLSHANIVYGPGDDNALVLTSSYGGAILPLIAENYAETHISQQYRNSEVSAGVKLEELVEQSDAQDIYIITKPATLCKSVEICPDFFE